MIIDEKKLRDIKEKLYKSQDKKIKKVYKTIADNIEDSIKNKNEEMTEEELYALKDKIEEDIKKAKKEIELIISNTITKIVGATILTHKRFLNKVDKKYKVNLSDKYKKDTAYINKKVVDDILKGRIYKDNKKLSKRIWTYNKKTIKDMNHIINTGIKNKTNVYNIAKDLEKYVNPYTKKDFNWKKVYPNSSLKVDYNAQRLARTALNHAYQDAYIESVKVNPVIEYIEYNAAHNSRVCALCSIRDGKMFKPDDVPYDHPNGNCYLTSVIPDNLTDKIAEIVNDLEI